MQMMELMEILDDGVNYSDTDYGEQERLKKLMVENEKQRLTIGKLFSESFEEGDWSRAKEFAAKLNYLVRVRDAIYDKLEVGSCGKS